MQGKNWIFTSTNYTPDEVSALQRFGAANEGFVYLVFGYETVPNTGTPHLQGFLVLSERKRHAQLMRYLFFVRAWLQIARGTPTQAVDYCKKGENFEEFGELPAARQGKRYEFEELREWCGGSISIHIGPTPPSYQAFHLTLRTYTHTRGGRTPRVATTTGSGAGRRTRRPKNSILY